MTAAPSADDVVRDQLAELGLGGQRRVHRNLPPAELIARSLARGEGILAANGALVVKTGEPSGRSPEDRVIVEEGPPPTRSAGATSTSPASRRSSTGCSTRRAATCTTATSTSSTASPAPSAPTGCRSAWSPTPPGTRSSPTRSSCARRRSSSRTSCPGSPSSTAARCAPAPTSTARARSVFVGISFTRKLVLILGSMYGGEMKKAIFSVMNYLLPQRDVLPMHCSANVGESGDVALFFGLSGTGKTTLSADPARRLIGDDEHGWSDHSIFNFEGGCYAKTIRLSAGVRAADLQRHQVRLDPRERDHRPADAGHRLRLGLPHREHARDLPDRAHPRRGARRRRATTRATSSSSPATRSACCRRSRKLTPEMASYHFLSGFTSKVAGTEVGIDEPRPTFSACFGAPFMPLHPSRYATMLAERLSWHETDCWLVNTGWTGGPYGVGHRMSIELTRALIAAALDGSLAESGFTPHPVFKVLVPHECRRAPAPTCSTRARRWADEDAYDAIGARARRDVPRELRAVRRARVARGAGGGAGRGVRPIGRYYFTMTSPFTDG